MAYASCGRAGTGYTLAHVVQLTTHAWPNVVKSGGKKSQFLYVTALANHSTLRLCENPAKVSLKIQFSFPFQLS